jgi:hypothetical protein
LQGKVYTGTVGKPAGYISEHSDENSSSAVEFNFFFDKCLTT